MSPSKLWELAQTINSTRTLLRPFTDSLNAFIAANQSLFPKLSHANRLSAFRVAWIKTLPKEEAEAFSKLQNKT